MRQVVNGAKGGPILGHSSCMSLCKSQSEEENDFEEDQDASNSPSIDGSRPQIEQERRLRREIANSNERRRMQSINQGFMSLKKMLPVSDGGEKLSKAAVLQNAADYMVQILEERKQLLLRNAELSQALSAHRQLDESLPPHKKRKRDVTESSDEGISMCYQPPAGLTQESEGLIEDLRRTVAELRHQLERETDRRLLLEQSYTYSLMAAQAVVPPPALLPGSDTSSIEMSQQLVNPLTAQLSPPQSRHTSTDEQTGGSSPQRLPQYDSDVEGRHDSSGQSYSQQLSHNALNCSTQTFGKASSVASQNLSIIVEAINHLEGDGQPPPSSDKEVDSGVSHGESSDDAKSESSESPQPPAVPLQSTATSLQPPPAHQSAISLSQHRIGSSDVGASLYTQQQATSSTVNTTIPLTYRPTFLSTYISSQAQPHSPLSNYVLPRQPHSL